MKHSLHFKQYIQLVEASQVALRQTFFLFTFLFLLFTYFTNGLIHQIGNNPLVYQEIDPTYWLFMILNIPEVFSGPSAVILDSILFISCLGSLLFPKQTLTCWVFFVSHFLYFILYNLLVGHHYIHVGILFLSFPFLFVTSTGFSASFTFCRFLFCQMLLFAALWKIVRGNLWYVDQSTALFIQQLGTDLFEQSSFRFQVIRFFFHNPLLGHLLWVAVIVLEAVFLIGFITWKKDRWLLISYLLFFLGGWFFLDVYIIENLILLITLGPILKIINQVTLKVLREKQHPAALSNLTSGVPLPDERSSSRH